QPAVAHLVPLVLGRLTLEEPDSRRPRTAVATGRAEPEDEVASPPDRARRDAEAAPTEPGLAVDCEDGVGDHQCVVLAAPPLPLEPMPRAGLASVGDGEPDVVTGDADVPVLAGPDRHGAPARLVLLGQEAPDAVEQAVLDVTRHELVVFDGVITNPGHVHVAHRHGADIRVVGADVPRGCALPWLPTVLDVVHPCPVDHRETARRRPVAETAVAVGRRPVGA